MQGYTRAVFAEICRLCATNRNGGNVEIFGEQGQMLRLQDKMQALVNIKVSDMDHLPKVICQICSSKLEELHAFWHACQSSETMLNNFYNRAKNFDYFKNTGMVYIENNQFNHSEINEKLKKNDYIVVPHQEKANIANVKNSDCVALPKQEKVNVCNLKIIISQNQATQPAYKRTQETVKILKIDTLPAPAVPHQTQNVVNNFTAPQLSNHVQYKQEAFESRNTYIIDLDDEEAEAAHVKMEASNDAYPVQQQRQQQPQAPAKQAAAKPTRQYVCQQCGTVFHRREHLFQHNKVHSGLRPYKCAHCSKTFVRKEHLLRHETAHTGRKDHTCDLCARSFSRKDNLLKHRKTHEKDVSYACAVCRKTFVLKYYYDQHMETAHAGAVGAAAGVCVKLEHVGGDMVALKLG